MSRIFNEAYRSKVMSADDAAALIHNGDNIGFSGFTGAGYPKVVPGALATRIKAAHARGDEFRIGVYTGASTAPELDGALAETGGISFRAPYQSDPIMRKMINKGVSEYSDMHLSHSAIWMRQGFLGHLNVTVIEEDGTAVPSSSIGNNNVYLDTADKIILEVNEWQSLDLEGMHDIYYGTELPPNRRPIPLTNPADRIGQTTLRIDFDKVIAVVESNAEDRNTPFKPLDDDSRAIAGHLIDFLGSEVTAGRMPANLLPLQSGVGNIANAVLFGLEEGPFGGLTSYTEVIQDGMIRLLKSGKVTAASATAFSLSPEMLTEVNADMASYRDRIVLRPQEIS